MRKKKKKTSAGRETELVREETSVESNGEDVGREERSVEAKIRGIALNASKCETNPEGAKFNRGWLATARAGWNMDP